jgi:hypothetical protein
MTASGPEINPNAAFPRRYDLDWLRIIAFGLLIFYHTGMFFVTWGWHVKSTHANTGPEYAMMLLNPWRLALLFFISGVAVRFLADKLGTGGFLKDRVVRLLPVIVFGMVVVVMPQTWAQLRQAGVIDVGILEFWPRYLTSGTIGGVIVPTWNHLWYVVYLLVYCLLLAPVLPLLRRIADGPVERLMQRLEALGPWGVPLLLLVPVLPFFAIDIWLEPHFPTTHNLVWDWANHAHRLTVLLYGYMVAKSPSFWRVVDRTLPLALAYAVFFGWAFGWAITRPDGDWAGQDVLLWMVRLGRIVYAWASILTLFVLARRFLTHDSPARRYLTEAIFPIYILHQTIIVLVGYWIAPMHLGAWPEFAIIVTATVVGCGLGFEIVRRIPPLRPTFGLKWKAPAKGAPSLRRAQASS